MENSDVHTVIEYLQKKGLSPKEIHEDIVGVLDESAPFYQVVKNIFHEGGSS